MRKRFLALFTSLCMVVMLLAGGVTANAAGSSWDEEANRDTSWTDGAISTAEQLAQFAYLVNSGIYSGSNNVWLTNDIDLAGKEWVPIGNLEDEEGKLFYHGLFNGNGFTVHNMTITDLSNEGYNNAGFYGLFGLLGEGGTIQYVTVTGSITATDTLTYRYTGGIAGYVELGKIIGCVNEVNISIDVSSWNASPVGGITGAAYGDIIGCINNGDIYINKGNSSETGGIAGLASGHIDRCVNNGNLKGYTTYIGGIAGYIYPEDHYDLMSPMISNCINMKDIEFFDNSQYVYYGGIAGYARGSIKNSYTIGSPIDMDAYWGNIAAELRGQENLENCYYLDNSWTGLARYETNFIESSPELDQGTKLTAEEMQTEAFTALLNGSEQIFTYNAGGYPQLNPLAMSVTIKVTPADASVVVKQGDTVIDAEADGTYLLPLGQYSVTVSAEDYITKTEAFTITYHTDSHTININLEKEEQPADYSKVDEVIKKVPVDLSIYTDQSVQALKAAVNAVVRGKNADEQELVNSYAKAIEDAIGSLVYKAADYSAVDTALKKVPADLSIYTDESVKAVTDAVNAVIRGKNITEQEIVDGYAKAIETAVGKLVKKQKPEETKPTETKPSESVPATKKPNKPTGSPDTGDNGILPILLLMSAAGVCGVIIIMKKRQFIKAK